MNEQELIEQLADKEHASWAHWMDYLFSKCTYTMHGDAIIPMPLALRWKIQANQPYERLSEQEKQSDRDEVAHILRSEEHTSELQSPDHIVCRLLLEKKKNNKCGTQHPRSI